MKICADRIKKLIESKKLKKNTSDLLKHPIEQNHLINYNSNDIYS